MTFPYIFRSGSVDVTAHSHCRWEFAVLCVENNCETIYRIDLNVLFCYLVTNKVKKKNQHKRGYLLVFYAHHCRWKCWKNETMLTYISNIRIQHIRWWICTNAMLWYKNINMCHVRLYIKWSFDWMFNFVTWDCYDGIGMIFESNYISGIFWVWDLM